VISSSTQDSADFPGAQPFGGSGNLSGGSDFNAAPSLAHPFTTYYSYDVFDNVIEVDQGVQQRKFTYSALAA